MARNLEATTDRTDAKKPCGQSIPVTSLAAAVGVQRAGDSTAVPPPGAEVVVVEAAPFEFVIEARSVGP
jgi:hypothetical protein